MTACIVYFTSNSLKFLVLYCMICYFAQSTELCMLGLLFDVCTITLQITLEVSPAPRPPSSCNSDGRLVPSSVPLSEFKLEKTTAAPPRGPEIPFLIVAFLIHLNLFLLNT